MAYSETTTVGYGKRVSNSFKGIFIGFVLLIAGTVLLWWNEGRAVKTAQAIKGAVEQTISVADLSNINHELNGKMICASGYATTNDSISDQYFGFGTTAIRIERKVEFYQWVEQKETKTEDKVGGKQEQTTTYNYDKTWVSAPVDSREFKNSEYKGKNFAVINDIKSSKVLAKNVTVGAYTLPEQMIESISSAEPMSANLTDAKEAELNKKIAANLNQSEDGDFVSVSNNTIYLGKNPNSPEIGDVKITFTKVVPATVTIWARVANNSFERFTSNKGYSVGGLYMGDRKLDELHEQAESTNSFISWMLRIVGLVVVFFGLKGMFKIIISLLKVLPFLANIANVGISIVCGVVAFAWSLIIIALAWLFYRPILAIILIAVVIGLFVFLSKRSKNAKSPAEQ